MSLLKTYIKSLHNCTSKAKNSRIEKVLATVNKYQALK